MPGCRCARRVLASFGIERLACHVSAVLPSDGARLGVYWHEREVLGIAQPLKDASPIAPCEVDLADCSVVEGQGAAGARRCEPGCQGGSLIVTVTGT